MSNIIDFDSLDELDGADDVVNFDEEAHSYTSAIDGRQYISTTTLIKQYGLTTNDYDGVPLEIMKRKAAYGSAVHKALEEYIKGDMSQTIIPEVQAFHDWLTSNAMNNTDCVAEQQVFNFDYGVAGTVDLQFWNTIADFKTTASLHTVSVMWQLSIYNYLLHPDEVDYNMYNLKCFWFTSTGELTVKDIPLINYHTLIDMLEAYKRGDVVWVDSTMPMALTDKVDELIKQRKLLKTLKDNLKTLENEEEVLKEAIKEQMADQQRSYVKTNTGLVTLTDTTYSRFDNTKVEALLTRLGEQKKDYIKATITTRMNVKELKT